MALPFLFSDRWKGLRKGVTHPDQDNCALSAMLKTRPLDHSDPRKSGCLEIPNLIKALLLMSYS